MKLLRYGPKGQEKPGLLDKEGRIRDLSDKINDIDGAFLASDRADLLTGACINVDGGQSKSLL